MKFFLEAVCNFLATQVYIYLSLFLFTDYAFGIQIYSKLDSKVFVVYGEIFIALYHKCAAGFHAPQFGLDRVGH